MYSAFDTVNRCQLPDIVNKFMKVDKLRIICFLLRSTEINTRINGSSKQCHSLVMLGPPRRQTKSSTVYHLHPNQIPLMIEKSLVRYHNYAIDWDFIPNITRTKETLEKHQLKVNTNK
ncbi:hypothetical protein ElyMa_001919100 [Elysia marginata]|uniref:Uncharacterized protein n=1 Tax=Elysia marginata TaxID=1093978 RepID=A0AAV4EV28_9GAST|nr:hypothetical protein ElyMa_001919100 [Elysia marginata]